ncbi:TonB-dependent receptor, partial [Escherichia coli]
YEGKGEQGAYLPLIPPLKIWSSITQKITTASKWFTSITPKVEVEWAAKQNRFLGLNHTETPTPGYALLHIGLTADIRYYKSRSMQLYIQVMNLLDKVYQSNLSRLKYFEYYNQSPNGHSGMYNMGRNICVKLVLPF